MDTTKKIEEATPVDLQKRIRITLTSTKVKALETACNDIVRKARNAKVETHGPVRLPTKVLRITTRKTPCGEGSKTWDRYQMRIHKRNIDIVASREVVRTVAEVDMDTSVSVEVTVRTD